MNTSEQALDHRCPSCGGKLLFTPSNGKWTCEYCASVFDLETLQKFDNASNAKSNAQTNTVDDTSYVEYRCQNCGASIVADDQTASTFCVYCGNTAILKSKLSGKFAPSKIIPFSKTKEEAITAFKSLSKGRPLMPKFFNQKENIEKISGVYIPFWLYTMMINAKADGKGERVSTWTTGNYTYTKTDTYLVRRDVDLHFDRVPVDGSTRFADDIMNSIEPFDYGKLVDYNHAYLSGFLAEKYDVEKEAAIKDAQNRVSNSAKDVLNQSMSQYTFKNVNTDVNVKNVINTEYVLLPVWMVNVKFNGKFYTFAMNAQTGEFVGNIPVDVKKAFIIGSILFLSIVAIVILISFITYLGG